MQEPGREAGEGVGRHPEVAGDAVGGQEADAVHLAGQLVGRRPQHLERAVAVPFGDLERDAVRHLVGLEENHQVAQVVLAAPGGGDPPEPHLADAAHLAQPLGRLVDHLEGLEPEMLDQPLGGGFADAFDQPRAEEPFDAFEALRLDRLGLLGAELLAELAVADPFAGQPQGLARLAAEQRCRPP